MNELRIWIAATLGWALAVGQIDRLFGPMGLSSWIYMFTAAAFVIVVFSRKLQVDSPPRVCAVAVGAFLLCKALSGTGFSGAGLALTVTESCIVFISTALFVQIRHCLDEFAEAAADVALMQMDTQIMSFDIEQSEIYREIRRAREFDRPLALLAIAATEESVRQSMNRLIDEVQRNAIEKYVHARIAGFLSNQTNHCDLITRRNNHFVLLLPETDSEGAHHLARRLKKSAFDQLGLTLRAGAASFPDEEVTFTGLLERAEAEMSGYDLKLVSEH